VRAGGLLASPLATQAQQAKKVYRIGGRGEAAAAGLQRGYTSIYELQRQAASINP